MNDTDTSPAVAPRTPSSFGKPAGGLRERLYTVIFEADTRAGRRFDMVLIATILLSIAVVVMASVPRVDALYGREMNWLEWGFTLLFSVEYLARLACVRHPWRYATSFFGVIDLLSILPTYFALVVPEASALLDIRILRLLRVFRVFKLTLYVVEYTRLAEALRASARKILVFLSVVLMAVLILGTAMYVVEGPSSGFTSIPMAMYWATVTMTTVGYGDLTPQTPLGRMIASFMMLLGWGILAVPTGIVTAEMTSMRMRDHDRMPGARSCPSCGSAGHALDARFCSDCGAAMPDKGAASQRAREHV